ncbi:MAG: YIP1 family protein [Defluviitaleaceae bacterium]|nr:YIP1 family protein [Defluviitaleaceae bacterium]
MKTHLLSLSYLWKVLLHPIDSFYELAYEGKGSVLVASIVYVLYFSALVFQVIVTNFIFNMYGLHGMPIPQIFVIYVVPVIVLTAANYLVSAIKQGQGTFRAVYIATAYALSPVVLFIPPLALISNVLSGAEAAIYDTAVIFIYVWVGFLYYVSVMEVHGYSIPEAFFNTIWIIFGAVMLVLFGAAFFGITFQSFNFLYEFLREVIGYV